MPRCLDYIWFSTSSLKPVEVLDTVGVPAGIETLDKTLWNTPDARCVTELEKMCLIYLMYSVFDFFASAILKCPVSNVYVVEFLSSKFSIFAYLWFYKISKSLEFNVFDIFTCLGQWTVHLMQYLSYSFCPTSDCSAQGDTDAESGLLFYNH